MASRVVTRDYDAALAPVGLSTNAYSILTRIDREGPRPIGELAARLAMDRTTLSREVAPLVRAGLVAVESDDADRRQRIVGLTDVGAARVAEARPLWAHAQAVLSGEFGPDRTRDLLNELHDLVGAA